MDIVNMITSIQTYTIIAVVVLIGLAAIGTAISFAILGGKFMESISRQPELSNLLLIRMFLLAGLIDAFSAIAVAVGLLLAFGTNPLLKSALIAVKTHVL